MIGVCGWRFCVLAAVICFGIVPGETVSALTVEHGIATSFTIQVQRVLLEGKNNSEYVSALTTRTERVDPLNDLKKYRGGYNITNKHYWSSTIFTGKYGYIIAALWLLVGIIYAGVLLIATICFNKRSRTYNRPLCFKRCGLWHILLGVILTVLAIITSGIVLGGSSRFHSRAKSTKNIIVATTQDATGTIYNVTEAVTAMEADSELYGTVSERSSNLNSTTHRLNEEAANIQRKAERDMRALNKGLNILKVVIIVTVVLNLTVILSLLASMPLKFRRTSQVLVIISWLLTTLFWIYFGLYFFLDKFGGDTCAALDEYRQDPQNSTLNSILSCNDQLSAMSILRDAGAEIHSLIDQANSKISILQSTYPGLQYVCNPISGPPLYKYQPENCSSNTIQIGDVSQILKRFTCSGNGNGTCEQGEFISASNYSRVLVFTNSMQSILDAFPGIERLVNCQLVKDAFSEILFEQCRPLKKFARMTWISLVSLSTIMGALVLTWTAEAHHNAISHSSDGSVRPQLLLVEATGVQSSDGSVRPQLLLVEATGVQSTEIDMEKMEHRAEL